MLNICWIGLTWQLILGEEYKNIYKYIIYIISVMCILIAWAMKCLSAPANVNHCWASFLVCSQSKYLSNYIYSPIMKCVFGVVQSQGTWQVESRKTKNQSTKQKISGMNNWTKLFAETLVLTTITALGW